MNYIFYIIIAWNIIVFALYGIDKWKAIHNKWRITEKTLILSAFLMGAAGALLGMFLFRHKIRHKKFKILVPLALVLNIAILIIVFYIKG